MQPLSEPTRRLFPELEDTQLADPEALPYIVIRLLEDGDAQDLRTLFQQLETTEFNLDRLVELFRARGGRQLSRRSRAFWQLLLGTEPLPPHPTTEEVWLL